MSDKPVCEKCGEDDAMIKHPDGEWVCHHTHPLPEYGVPESIVKDPVKEGMASIAVEDLITIVCETFVEELHRLGYNETDETVSLYEWYLKNKTDADRRHCSDTLMHVIEEQMKCDGSSGSSAGSSVCEYGTKGCDVEHDKQPDA